MTKIGTKLLVGFGIFICILLLHTIVGQLATKQAVQSHDTLTKKTGPAVRLLSAIRMENKELFLLVENRILDGKNRETLNRVKQIVEVDFPYYISNLVSLKKSLQASDSRAENIDSIAMYASKSIALIKQVNSSLLTSKDYEDKVKMEMILDIQKNELSVFSKEIDNRLSFLQIQYNKELVTNISNLSNTLDSNSRFFLWASIFFIFFGLLITYKNIISIVRPIKELLHNVNSIKTGNYQNRIEVKGKDELSMLGREFNKMSDSLHESFEKIKLKNKELEQFVYIASHDLQEPLRTVNSFTDLLTKEYKDTFDDKALTCINFISQASTRMSLLIRGLLDHSCIGGNKELSKVNCNDMVKSLEVDLSTLISENKAQLDIGTLPEVEVYQTEFRLLFQNLINNAIKFRKPNLAPVVKIKAKEYSNFWKFIISDNGIGIPKNKKDKIFGMFCRLNSDKDFEGTGIGLAHCLKIIELHNGSIKVDSEINKGSTFSIKISKNLHKQIA